jgi:hypothetical protein
VKRKPKTLNDFILLFQALKEKYNGELEVKIETNGDIGNPDEYWTIEDVVLHLNQIESLTSERKYAESGNYVVLCSN